MSSNRSFLENLILKLSLSFSIFSYLPFSHRRFVRSLRLNELRTKFQGFQKACDKSLALDIVHSLDQRKTLELNHPNFFFLFFPFLCNKGKIIGFFRKNENYLFYT